MRLLFKCFFFLCGILFAGNSFAENNVGTVVKFDPGRFKVQSEAQLNRMQGPFYFVDAPLYTVIGFLEQLLGKPILCSSNIQQTTKITFQSKKKMQHEDAIEIFRAILMLNGIAIISVNDKYYKAVPVSGVSTHVPKFLIGRASDLPASQDFYTKFFELSHIKVSDIESKLKSSMTLNNVGVFETFPKSNAFWITDTLVNLQRIEELVNRLDTQINRTKFIQIHHTSADEIKEKIAALKLDSLANATLVSDVRTNKLIVIAPPSAIDEISGLVSELDIESEAILKSEVVYIKHGEALKMVEVLSKIVNGQKSSKDKKVHTEEQEKLQGASQTSTLPTSAQQTPPPNGNPAVITKKSLNEATSATASSGVEFSDQVQIVAEERSNAIVIYGTSADIKQIKSVIEKLDIVLTQVKIDVLITEVTLSDDQVSGLSSFGINYNTDDSSGFSGTIKTYNLKDSSTPAFSASAGENSFAMLFDIARQRQNVKVLSSPTIVTTHNKQAEINISQSLPIITSSMSDMTSITTQRSSVSYKDIGIRLLVTPLVGNNGSIQLEIDQSVDSISGYTTIDNNQQPTISKRKATSFVSARDNEVIILAGLQQIDTSELGGNVWLLSDIPLIGGLFQPNKNNYTRRELIIFIRPSVVTSLPYEKQIQEEIVENSPAKEEIKTFYSKGKFYPNKELEKNAEEFENRRLHKRILNSLKDAPE